MIMGYEGNEDRFIQYYAVYDKDLNIVEFYDYEYMAKEKAEEIGGFYKDCYECIDFAIDDLLSI